LLMGKIWMPLVAQIDCGAVITKLVDYCTYALNVAKSNIDVQANPDTINGVLDRILTQIGSRKVVIENDRYCTANTLLYSGAIDNNMGQASVRTDAV